MHSETELGRGEAAAWGPLPEPDIRVLAWKPLVRDTRGFIDIAIKVGQHGRWLEISECPVHAGANGPWVALPGKPQIDRDGNIQRKPNGRPDYVAVLKWSSVDDREAFSRTTIKLLLTRHPDALAEQRR